MRLHIVIFSTIFLILGCVSTNVVDDSHSTDNKDNNSNKHTDNGNSQNNGSGKTDLSSNTNDSSSNSSANTSSNTTTSNSSNSSSQNVPTISEEGLLAQYNITQLFSSDGDDNDWKKFREAYISQYLKDPKYIPAALGKSIPKNVIEYLKKGYGMYWSPVKGIEKELEYGFLATRSDNSAGIDSHLSILAARGKSSGYYTLVYIAAMYYVKNNDIAKAKSIANENDLFQNIENFAIEIPEADLQRLQSSIK